MNAFQIYRMRLIGAVAICIAAVFATGSAFAKKFPDQPIALIVPYGAGGPTDQHLRAIADEAGKLLGQPVVLDNRTGENGTNGASALPRATPDGYTLAVMPASVYWEPSINKVGYNPARSFSQILFLSDYSFGLAVKADPPWKKWRDLAADAAKNPGKINVGATGAIGTPRMVMDEAADLAKIRLNMVPYKGDADIAVAILGGHLDAVPLSGVAAAHIADGKMRYLVMLTEQRVKRYPDLPTLKELGVDAWIESPYGIAGPSGMDPARVKILHDAFKKGLESVASMRAMDQLNQQINYKDPEAYRKYALETLMREKIRVDRLRERGLLN